MQYATMVRVFPHLTSACRVRWLRISLPLVGDLLDGVRYFRPNDLPPPAGEDLRAMNRPKLPQHATVPRTSA
jgi:hypothetical protein